MTKLSFTLGPVQGFIAQARRTRDLWSGSFLLSYLAGHAIAEVQRHGGRIKYPAVEQNGKQDKLLAAIKDSRAVPDLATLPNRFTAEIPDNFDPRLTADAVRNKWKEMASDVWEQFVKPIAELGNGVETIWERQIETFWEIAWTTGEGNDLDRRKNWRSASPFPEGGTVCSIMPELQEISGHVRSNREARNRQEIFWTALRRQKQVGDHDLREDEHLCAVAMVKRFAPKLLKAAVNWPSTAYIAAVPFLRRAMETTEKTCEAYAQNVAKNFKGSLGEKTTRIQSVSRYSGLKFTQLDANFFSVDTLMEEINRTQVRDLYVEKALLSALKDIHTKAGQPGTYYAILAMDGDKLGQLLSKHPGNGPAISSALAIFTGAVPAIVEKHDGITVYAGGDDVLAIFPLDTSIAAAQELNVAYGDAFSNAAPALADGVSISGGLVLAHRSTPLQDAILLAHETLDNDAKRISDRDSLAIAVLQGNGLRSRWHGKWNAVDAMNKMIELVAGMEDSDGISSSILYGFREIFLVSMEPDSIHHTIELPPDFPLHELLSSSIKKASDHWENVLADDARASFVDAVIAACTTTKPGCIDFQYGGLFVTRSLAGAMGGNDA